MPIESNEVEINLEINKTDLEILDLLKKRLSLMAKIETPIANIKKEKRTKKVSTESNNYQLQLIHTGRKLGLRRTLVRKIFRSLEQENAYFAKRNKAD
jgi:chorismate mutase